MMTTPIIIWFLAPIFFGGAITFLGGYAIGKLVEYIITIKYLSVSNLRKDKKSFNTLNKRIRKGIDDPTTLRFSMKDFIVKEDGKIYTGNYHKGKVSNVAEVNYDTIDSDLNKRLNELDKGKLLLI